MSQTSEKNAASLTPTEAAQQCLRIEAAALGALAENAQAASAIATAAQLVHSRGGKVVCAGLGKSGLAAKKVAATLCSVGQPAIFLHATEAVHGDIGVVEAADTALVFSKSGSTTECVRLAQLLAERSVPMVAVLGNTESALARSAAVVLNASAAQEADPLHLAPTASVLTSLALGDALASALMALKNFRARDFALRHPSGQLGRNLTLNVRDVFHPLPEIATVALSAPLREVVIAMTEKPLGAACVVCPAGKLLGLVTDGDVRRCLQKHSDISSLLASDMMTEGPVTTQPSSSLSTAAALMEERTSKISVLPVVETDGTCAGLLRLHDIYTH